jgi:nitrite reductase/ring-hydroxylating ferredoxin subunit
MPVVIRDDSFPIGVEAERRLDRRRFLCASGAAAIAVLGGEWLARRALDAPVRLAVPAGLPRGEARALTTADGREVLAVRLDEATVVAFERRCPHLGCPVVWSATRARFECPCHRAAFEARSGRVLSGPPRRGLRPVVLEVA